MGRDVQVKRIYDPGFKEFRARYRRELAAHGEMLEKLGEHATKGRLTIVYAARDRDHNNATVLAELLRDG